MDNVETGSPVDSQVIDPAVIAPAEPVAPVAEPVETAPKEPKTRLETLTAAMKASKDGTLRGQHAASQPRSGGKFAGAPIAQSEIVQNQPAVEQAPQRPAMPKSLRKELEPHWNAAPQELVQAFLQRDADAEKGIVQYKTKAEQADSILKEFQPYEWILKNENATPASAIAPLLQTAAILRTGTPSQKAQLVAQTMQQYGVPFEHIASMFGGQQQGGQPAALDPSLNALYQEVNGLKQQLQTSQHSQEQFESQRALSVIEQFKSDPANVHFEAVKEKVAALLQTPNLLGQDAQFLGERDLLQRAYNTAIKLDPNLSAQIAAQQQAEAQRVAREKAQQAVNLSRGAAVQVRGSPATSSVPNIDANDRRSVIANAIAAMGQS